MNKPNETNRPFIIEIVVCEPNTEVCIKVLHFKDVVLDYEASSSDLDINQFYRFTGDYKHVFKNIGEYRIAFRGDLHGLQIRDTVKPYYEDDDYYNERT